jgi:predicted nucleic acid-binding protein
VILLDTSGVLAAIDADQPQHTGAARLLTESEPRILSPFVLTELDYLLATRIGQGSELAFLAEVARTAYHLDSFTARDIHAARQVIERYAALDLGLADASIVVLAERYGCTDILTLDERHFRAVLGPNHRPFRLLPTDASPTNR